MFDNILQEIEERISLPFPERTYLMKEIKSDMETHFQSLIQSGRTEADALDSVKKEFSLTLEDCLNLDEIYRGRYSKALSAFSDSILRTFESVFFAIFWIFILNYLLKETPMTNLLFQAGPVSYLVVGIGLWALALQVWISFRWFVKKDHSENSLRSNIYTPIYLAGLAILIGIFNASAGIYNTFFKVANKLIEEDLWFVGVYESMTNISLSFGIAILILVFHVFIQSRAKFMLIPMTS